jgi:hypothetical protein
MAKLTIEGYDLVLNLSFLEKLAAVKRSDREALFPFHDNKLIFGLSPRPPQWDADGNQLRLLPPWVRSASVVPDAYEALKQDIPVWRMYPPSVPNLPMVSPKVVLRFSWDTGTLAIVYGIHSPAVLVEGPEKFPLRRLVITVSNPESVVASIRARLG